MVNGRLTGYVKNFIALTDLPSEATGTLLGNNIGSSAPPIALTAPQIRAILDPSTYATATASGTNTYTASLSPAISAYVAGMDVTILFTNANSGASTLNLNSLGAKAIQLNGAAVTSGEIPAGSTLTLVYDGTEFQIVGSPGSGGGSGTVTSVAYTGDGVVFNSTVSGSPITTSGTFVPALLTQTANTGLLGPSSGSAASPTFRSLVSADIPSLLSLYTSILTQTGVKTTTYSASANQLVPCDSTSGAFTVTLPNAPAAGTIVGVKIVTLGAGHNITVACAGSDVFNKSGGATSATLQLLAQAILVQYDSGIWYVLADDLPLTQTDARYLQVANNLSDVASASTAFANIVQAATTSTLGGVKPDGTIITVSAGAITVPKATTGAFGVVEVGTNIGVSSGVISVATGNSSTLGVLKPDGTIITVSGGAITVPKASSSVFGVVEVDNATILATSGVIATGPLNNLTAPTGALSLNTQQITNLVDPTTPQMAATKNYVDLATQAISAKGDCQAATTTTLASYTYNNVATPPSGVGATITLTTAAVLVVGGYTPNLGDRLLIKNETGGNAPYNGLYTLTTVGTLTVQAVLTRTTDFDQPGDGINGALVAIIGGTNAGSLYYCTATGSINFGTTNLTFSPFTGTTYSADGTTLTLTGTTFSVNSTFQATLATLTGTQTLTNKTLTTPAFTGLATGTGVASAATASTLASRDANANLTANNVITSYVTTASGSPITLTASSSYQQYFTGTTSQVILPVTSTLVLGQSFALTNISTTNIAVQASGGGVSVAVLLPGSSGIFTCILLTGTTAASWSYSGGGSAPSVSAANMTSFPSTVIGTVLIQDQKSSGTSGGTSTSGSWQTRVLNTKVYDGSSLCTLSSNQFVLTAGTYRIRASVPAFNVDQNQARLFDVTNSVVLATGTSEYSGTASQPATTRSVVDAVITSTGQSIALQQQLNNSVANGLGPPCSFGTEVYSTVFIERIG